MRFKTIASPLALVAALALSSTAFAQTMVGDQDISDDDLPAVTEHCAMLADADAGMEAGNGDTAADDAVADDTAADDMAADDATAADDSMAADDTAEITVDLEAITLEECQAAGLAM